METLSAYLKRTGYNSWPISRPDGTHAGVRVFTKGDSVPELFRLSDYRVISALSGPSYALAPK